MSDDPITRIETEQGIRDVAHIMRVFFIQLIDEGFTHIEALQMTNAYLAALLVPRDNT